MEKLKQELLELLKEKGAVLMGVADMQGIENCDYPIGISVVIPIPKHIIEDLKTAPTKEYYDLYHSLNGKLNEIVEAGEAFLREKGYHAFANTTDIQRGETSPLQICWYFYSEGKANRCKLLPKGAEKNNM